MPGPVAGPRMRAPRLQSINRPASVPAYKADRNKPPVRPTIAAPAARSKKPKYVCCEDQVVGEPAEDGSIQCDSCGQILESESNIVSEVQFGENAAGGAVVQGGFVGDNQRHANTMGGTARGLGGMASREQTEYKGKLEIQKLVAALRQKSLVEDQAFALYRLALNHNFVQGRRIRNVAAICIYLAARRQPENTLLLIDLAETIQVNVWQLGDTYKQFLQTIMMDDPAKVNPAASPEQIEPLMRKYCLKLEFGTYANDVARDASRLLKRMNRDWMVDGRQPAGLCGACIILAARMNNFRRTVREVVYVVKVADSTINSRLYEFRQTKSSQLTVQQFKEFGERIRDEIMPPSIWRREQMEERKRKRARGGDDEDEEEDEDTGEDAEIDAESTSTARRRSTRKKKKVSYDDAPSREPRRDQDGFVIPEVPHTIDLTNSEDAEVRQTVDLTNSDDAELNAELEELADAVENDEEIQPLPVKKRRGRPPKKRAPIVISPEDLDVERVLEEEVSQSIAAWDEIFKDFRHNESHPILVAAGVKAKAIARDNRTDGNVPEAEYIEEDEFADDEEVVNCLNTPDEIRMKERVWVSENEEWLREQQRKILNKELEEIQNKDKKQKTRRKHRQMGDGSLLEGRQVNSSAQAAALMMEERAKGSKFSQHIDYEALMNMMGKTAPPTPESSTHHASPAASGDSSQPVDEHTPPQRQQQPTPPQTQSTAPADTQYAEQGDEYYDEDEDDEEQLQYDDLGEFIDPGHPDSDDEYY